MTSVRLENLSKHFGQTVALDSTNLTIEAGELFFLLGPSGCGKSTLLRLIAGLHEPTTGKIFFNDKEVTALPTAERNAVMVFQSYALWPHMSVAENVRFGLEVRNLDKREQLSRVNEVLKLVHMEQYAKRKPNELSGGQQQRVALARALVVKPDCLLLDEPLSNLDAKLRLDMRSEIRRICRTAGLTAIYVTHDQKEALSIADRMAILNHGKIEQIGKPQDLYRRPDSKFIANFMGETNFLDAHVTQVQTNVQPNQAMLRTNIGELLSAAVPETVRQGDTVTVSLRPESIKIAEFPLASRVNVFNGIVHDTIYLGEVAQHQLKLPGPNGQGTQMKVFELNPKFVARDDTTKKAQVWFEPTDVVVLTK
jgi:iron(III) transport system ATP-binding protein